MRSLLLRFIALVIVSIVAPISGCGLREYEDKMERAQARYERFDKTSKELDQPIIPPVLFDKDGKPRPNSFYLRPPKGINSQAENEKQPRGDLLYSYRLRSGASSPINLVEVAFPDERKEFANDVLRFFPVSEKTVSRRTRTVKGPEPMTFHTYEIDDGTNYYSVNIYKGKPAQAAIIFWSTPNQKAAANNRIDLSLETFGTGPSLERSQREFWSRSPLEWVPRHGN